MDIIITDVSKRQFDDNRGDMTNNCNKLKCDPEKKFLKQAMTDKDGDNYA